MPKTSPPAGTAQEPRDKISATSAAADIGGRIRLARERRDLSLRRLAAKLDISPSGLSQIETGRSRPSVGTLYAIVSELGISLDDLFSPDGGARPARLVARAGEPEEPVTPEHCSSLIQREIRSATLQLSRRHGFSNVTTEMIASAAGVSPRTFFNYFPTKEAAVLPLRSAPPADMLAAFIAAGPDHPRVVLSELTDLLLADLAANELAQEDLEMFRLAEHNPSVLAAVLEHLERFTRGLADAVAKRLDADPGAEMPELIANLAMSPLRAGLQRWSQDHPSGGQESALSYLSRAVSLLHELLALESPAPPDA